MRILALLLLLAPTIGQADDNVRYKTVKPKPPPKQRLTRRPKLIRFVKASYPAGALKRGIQGSVKLQIVIDAKGNVSSARVISGPGQGLGRAALEAVKRFKFSPALVNGKPAPVRLKYTYHFRIKKVVVPKPQPKVEQGTILKGRVLERSTRLPIQQAAVAIPKLKLEVVTDKQGRFVFPKIKPGSYRLVIYSVRHRTTRKRIVIKQGVTVRSITIRPNRLVAGPYEVIVIGRRPIRGISRKTLQKQELRTVPGTFGDPLRAIQNFPGIARPPFLIGILVVRGATPGDSSIFVDGHEVPLIYHFLGGPSVLNASFLERIDFFPGNFSTRFGRTVTGLINVQTTRPKRKKWGGDVNISLLDAGAYVSGPISKKVSIALSARRSYIDAIIPLVLKSQTINTVLPVYYDYQLRLDVDLKGDDYFSVFGFGSDDQLKLVTTQKDAKQSLDLNSHIGFHRLNFKWLFHPWKRWRMRLSPIVGVDFTTFVNDSGTGDEISFDLTVWEAGVRHDVTHFYSKNLRFDFGLDLVFRHVTISTKLTTPPDFRPPPGLSGNNTSFGGGEVQSIKRRLPTFNGALYFETTFKPLDWWTVIAGARLTYYRTPGSNYVRLDPRLNMSFAITKNTSFKLGAGLFSQPPLELFLDPTFGSPDLKPSWAEHYSISVEHRFTRYFRIEASVFYLHLHNQTRTSRAVVFSADGTPKSQRLSQAGEGESFGLELLIRHDPYKWFYGWISYTLMRNQETERDGERYVPGPFDQTHILTIVASFKLGRGWELGLRFRAVSGRPDTPVIAGTLSSDTTKHVRLTGLNRSTRRPFFHQLDFRVEKTWKFNLWQLKLYLDIQNVYYSKNPEAVRYDYRFVEKQLVPGIPILPTIGIRGKF